MNLEESQELLKKKMNALMWGSVEEQKGSTTGKGTGLRDNKGKERYDLLSPFALAELVKILTIGSGKYAARNWEMGLSWTSVVASLKRHLAAFESGEDVDPETGCLHISHVECNAHFLAHFSKFFKQGDDRPFHHLYLPNIALDLDGVVCDFYGGFSRLLEDNGIYWSPNHWSFPYSAKPFWEEIKANKDFWMGLKPLCSSQLPFEPCGYVTFRPIPVEWTEEWLDTNGFPPAKIIAIDGNPGEHSKAKAIKSLNADIFVDDNYKNFADLNRQGILCYLMDKPYNEIYNKVGNKRIKDLAELVK